MKRTKSLIAAFSALLLTTGAAFAGGDSWTSTGQMSSDSVEAGGPQFLGGDTLSSEQYNDRFPSSSSETPAAMDSEALAEVDSELPLGG